MSTDVASARFEWEEAGRRVDDALRDPARSEGLAAQLELLTRELRKRVGGVYTMSELSAEYRRADVWARDAVAEHAPSPGWPATLALVQAAAFHAVSQGAVDYAP